MPSFTTTITRRSIKWKKKKKDWSTKAGKQKKKSQVRQMQLKLGEWLHFRILIDMASETAAPVASILNTAGQVLPKNSNHSADIKGQRKEKQDLDNYWH